MDYAEKMERCHEYVEALEEERRKIQVFHRELPLCLELVSQAIEACRQQLSGTTASEYMHGGQSECSEQTTSEGPVLEEFMPIKRSNSSDDDDEQQSHKPDKSSKDKNNNDKKKSDWLRSVQLWNQTPDPSPIEDLPRRTSVTEVKRNGGAFQPFHREKSVGKTSTTVGKAPSSVSPTATSSTVEAVTIGSGGSSKSEDKEGQAQRKQRRCWSPELHRRFLHALQQLGGSHAAATPKQIRELMKVDGLTNDEVKSHLQKYRLHTRRPTIHNNANPQAPQFVVVGGIWVPPPEYAAVAATTASGEAGSMAAANGIYAPVATPPPPRVPHASASLMQKLQQKQPESSHSEERGSLSEGGVHSNSPATSSSTHTTTGSPVF